ncbi:MAG: glycosyltransferase family 2 protein [Spirosomaceae bacterium]|nr:glycosyltransferase family 2 protein [Spirosomataceae bacterium]
MNTPLVSIVTVNFHQTEVTCELLSSLQNITYPNVEIWVVDNHSNGTLKGKINTLFPSVKVIESRENLGFAGGNNLAIAQSKGEFLMFLNNDTEVSPNFLEPLIATMNSDEKIGICSSKIHYFNSPNTIQYAGSSDLHPIKIQSFSTGFKEKDKGQYDQTKQTYLAHGAAMLVRKSAIQKVGPMPEEFFLYYEEIDWCLKFRQVGYKIFYVHDSLVLHKESISVGKQSAVQIYYKTRNRILLARKWRSGLPKLLALTYLSLVSIRDLAKYFLTKKNVLLKIYWDALVWNLQGNWK